MKYLLFLSIVICTIMCGSAENHHRVIAPKCIALNDSGVAYIKKYRFHKDTNDLNIALKFLDQATECDTNYVTATGNKLTVYLLKNDNEKIMKCHYTLIRLTNNSSSARLALGMYLESVGHKDSAYSIYGEVNKEVEMDLQKQNEFDFDKVQMYLLTSSIVNGVEIGQKRYDSIYNIYQNNSSAVLGMQAIKPFIDNIDSKEYLSGGANANIKISIPIKSSPDTIK